MDYTEPCTEPEETAAVIVKADEVDEAGADISTIVPNDSSSAEFDERIESRRAQDAETGGNPKVLANAAPSAPKWWGRPALRRDGSAPPPPPPQPPPPTPPQQREEPGNPTDSLSLMQLKKLVTELPKFEPTAYAFEYEDTRAFPEELEEWFQYTEEDRYTLLRAKQTFEDQWGQAQAERVGTSGKARGWTDVEPVDRENFVVGAVRALANSEATTRIKSLECISYIALGVWGETAGLEDGRRSPERSESDGKVLGEHYNGSRIQLNWIRDGARLLCKTAAVQQIVDMLRRVYESQQDSGQLADEQAASDEHSKSSRFLAQVEISHALTTLYTLVEIGRSQDDVANESTVQAVSATDLLIFLTKAIARLRWEESPILPLPRVLLLFWKTILLLLGGTKDLEGCKAALRKGSDETADEHGEDFITASPLDYHLFRQEITSKYPSYSPPPPLVPIELENNSILPPLPNHPSRRTSQENLHARVGPSVNGGGSIFNQPVHIATPAPSPPPSPAGPGGKGGKKQNYQTNQNFPFLYPPLDEPSNTVSGNGKAEPQDLFGGKRWEGSDVPASILEAGQLFASRMRMSRSIRQLWDVREKYIKYERGWNGRDEDHEGSEEARSETNDEDDVLVKFESPRNDFDPEMEKETENAAVQRRLDAVENYYRNALPYLQSLVIVLWKVTFANVSAMVSQTNGPTGVPNGFPFTDDNGDGQGKGRTNPNSAVQTNGMPHGQLSENLESNNLAIEELNALRAREITSKAIAGILLMLLKWFKLSHVLKFEYLTQLLLDANYLPLILKLFAHQDIDKAVEQKNDRADLDFFQFCRTSCNHPPPPSPQPPLSSPSPSSSEDEAQPPPILTHRRSPATNSSPPQPSSPSIHLSQPLPGQQPQQQQQQRPEVDEFGYPTTNIPSSPITAYSPRFFFTTITLLRLLQKITKRKAHRALLLVQYKSSTILRRALKIPQPQLRLYTLKLFKSQVPYCGRKWRQANMRVITAVYLHCRPELRDEWLCGGDVDGVVEEAVPLEQAGRALVHWWHLRGYRDVMEGGGGGGGGDGKDAKGGAAGERRDEGNFFERELERMGWGSNGGGAGAGVSSGGGDEEDGPEGGGGGGRNEWDGGPLVLEGWT